MPGRSVALLVILLWLQCQQGRTQVLDNLTKTRKVSVKVTRKKSLEDALSARERAQDIGSWRTIHLEMAGGKA